MIRDKQLEEWIAWYATSP